MQGKVTLLDRLKYEFDKSMAAGPVALIGWLTVVSLALIAIAALVIAIAHLGPDDGDGLDFFEAAWQALMRALDPGAVAADTGWAYRSVTLMVTLGGIFLVSTLIGIIGAGVNGKIEDLRKGRSRVLETGHTVIMNWSDSIFDIIGELIIANASHRNGCIVVLADKDKAEMEDELASKIGRRRGTRIICRSGDPTNPYDLEIVSPQTSKSVVILSPAVEDPDSSVIKTVLSLVADPRRPRGRYRIAAEIRDSSNMSLARAVGAEELQLVQADDLIARIVVHSARQSGLSLVYSDLLDFDGVEFYVTDQPALTGRTFGDVLFAHEACSVLGICTPEKGATLNPAMDTVIRDGDQLVIIAEDDASICDPDARPELDVAAIRKPPRRKDKPAHTLMLGWNRRARMVASELARFVAPGSTLTVCANRRQLDEDLLKVAVRDTLAIEGRVMETTSPRALATLDFAAYDHIIVMGYSDDLDAQAADTRTLVTLLNVRRLVEESGSRANVVSEIADVRNRELAEVTMADDYVVSNHLVSLMLAQASENQHLAAIFADLLDEEGSEIRLKPMSDFVALDHPVNFYTVIESGRRRGEIPFGYCRRLAGGGIVINPVKSEMLTFTETDRAIVLSHD